MFKERKRLIAIFLIAFGLRLILFLAVGSWQDEASKKRVALADTKTYTIIAFNLTKNKVFSRSELPPYEPELFYTPVYPLTLALIYTIFGYKPHLVIFLQLIIGSASCLLIYKIGKILFDARIAMLAGLFFAFEYSSVFYSNVLLAETLFSFLFLLHSLFLLKFFISDVKKWLVYSALFLALSTLTKPVSVYFFLFLIVVFLVHFRKDIGKGIVRYSAFTLIFIAVLVPWMTHNYTVSGKFLVSSAQKDALKWSFNPIIQSFKSQKSSPQELEDTQDLKLKNENRRVPVKKRIITTIKIGIRGTARFFMHPGSSIYPRLLGLSYRETEIKDLRKNVLESVKSIIMRKGTLERFIFFYCVSFLLFLYLTMCVGVLLSVKNNKVEALLIISLIILYFLIPSIHISWTPRYRLPIMPFVILLSCYGLLHLKTIFKKTHFEVNE